MSYMKVLQLRLYPIISLWVLGGSCSRNGGDWPTGIMVQGEVVPRVVVSGIVFRRVVVLSPVWFH